MVRRIALVVVAAMALAGGARAAAPVVVVDPGHDRLANLATEPIGPGSPTRKILDGGGTHGVVTGIAEPDLTLAVSLKLRQLLQLAGVRVVMTRTRTAGRSMGNVARAEIANGAHAALFLRVHADGASSSGARGTHTLTPALHTGWTDDVYAASHRAARLVQTELVHALGFPDRGIQERSDFTGFNWADVPVILVELGFMTNPTEDRELALPAVRERAALGLCRGTLRFLGLRPGLCAPYLRPRGSARRGAGAGRRRRRARSSRRRTRRTGSRRCDRS
jgi:N-acetylmuramoyl-L-alanine amidase